MQKYAVLRGHLASSAIFLAHICLFGSSVCGASSGPMSTESERGGGKKIDGIKVTGLATTLNSILLEGGTNNQLRDFPPFVCCRCKHKQKLCRRNVIRRGNKKVFNRFVSSMFAAAAFFHTISESIRVESEPKCTLKLAWHRHKRTLENVGQLIAHFEEAKRKNASLCSFSKASCSDKSRHIKTRQLFISPRRCFSIPRFSHDIFYNLIYSATLFCLRNS